MSTVLSADQEAVLAAAVSRGMFADTSQALDGAIRMLRETLMIDAAIAVGLNSGDSIEANDEFWAERHAVLSRRDEAGKQ